MDTDSLYLTLAEEDLDECIFPSERAEWTEKRSKDCRDDFRTDAKNNFFPRTCCSKHKKQDKREPGWRSSDAPKCYACVVKRIAAMIEKSKHKFNSKALLNKRALEDSGDEEIKKGFIYFYPKRKVELNVMEYILKL